MPGKRMGDRVSFVIYGGQIFKRKGSQCLDLRDIRIFLLSVLSTWTSKTSLKWGYFLYKENTSYDQGCKLISEKLFASTAEFAVS